MIKSEISNKYQNPYQIEDRVSGSILRPLGPKYDFWVKQWGNWETLKFRTFQRHFRRLFCRIFAYVSVASLGASSYNNEFRLVSPPHPHCFWEAARLKCRSFFERTLHAESGMRLNIGVVGGRSIGSSFISNRASPPAAGPLDYGFCGSGSIFLLGPISANPRQLDFLRLTAGFAQKC